MEKVKDSARHLSDDMKDGIKRDLKTFLEREENRFIYDSSVIQFKDYKLKNQRFSEFGETCDPKLSSALVKQLFLSMEGAYKRAKSSENGRSGQEGKPKKQYKRKDGIDPLIEYSFFNCKDPVERPLGVLNIEHLTNQQASGQSIDKSNNTSAQSDNTSARSDNTSARTDNTSARLDNASARLDNTSAQSNANHEPDETTGQSNDHSNEDNDQANMNDNLMNYETVNENSKGEGPNAGKNKASRKVNNKRKHTFGGSAAKVMKETTKEQTKENGEKDREIMETFVNAYAAKNSKKDDDVEDILNGLRPLMKAFIKVNPSPLDLIAFHSTLSQTITTYTTECFHKNKENPFEENDE